VNEGSIFSIPCSFTNIIKQKSLAEVDRECKTCLDEIITKIEFDYTSNLNKKHIAKMFFCQSQNVIPNFTCFPLNYKEDKFYFDYIHLNKINIFEIFNKKILQSESKLWNDLRKYRLSASVKAHTIKTCRTWNEMGLKNLAVKILKEVKLGKQGSINVSYGQRTESIALETFKNDYKKEVLKCGLVIDSLRPWLCASPDGIILNPYGTIEKVLEIKCPISVKNTPIIEGNKINLKYLYWNDNKLALKTSSMYYTQCQILMHCTGLDTCDLFIYNNIEPVLITIEKNHYFLLKLIDRMSFIYFNFYLPKLCS